MSIRPSSVLALAAALLSPAVAGCAKHTGILAPRITDPAVFTDGFGGSVDFQAFGGSKLDAIRIDSSVTYSGATSIRVTVPAAGSAGGTYAGGAFTTSRARDLSGYDAITFWVKADHAITVDVFGLGNNNTGNSKYEAKRSAVPVTTNWTKVVIALPLASRLRDEDGLFYFAEGPEAGAGTTIWLDDIVFENLGTVTNPRPRIPTVTLTPDVGADFAITGAQVTFAVGGTDQTLDVMPGYFSFSSSADTVVVGGEGTLRAVGLGSASVTATLGGVPAAGTITVAPNPAPVSAAPAPTVPVANALSLFCNTYPNAAVDTWSTTWDFADVTDVRVAGNDVKKYANRGFAAVEFTGAHLVNATAMTHFHVDVWAASGTNFKVKLVDFGADGVFSRGGDDREHELEFTSTSSPALKIRTWSSFEIPLSSFVGLTTRGHLAQMILSSGAGTFYMDNVYFHN